MSAESVYRYVRERESGARTYADSVDRVIERGSLARLWDTEGQEYLDCLSAAGTLALGHNHPAVTQAVLGFIGSGQVQQALDLTTPAKYRFLRQLFDVLPADFSASAKIQFCGPSGADATEAAVKLFKTATGRRTVLAFHGAYHGMTAGSLSLTGNLSAKQAVASLMPDTHFLPYPYDYRCPFGIGGEAGVRANLHYLERVLTDPESGITTPAAVFVEAVQGEGGVIPAPVSWLRGLRELTSRLDIPLVIDEIQTGFGRTGAMFAFEEAGVRPDAVLMSKAVGGGYPIALVAYDSRYDTWGPGAHAGTFRGNQIAMIAGAATMAVIEDEGLVAAAVTKGKLIAAGLAELAERHPEIGDVRGRGLMWGIEIVDPGQSADALGAHPADGARAARIKGRCLELGLIIERGGRHGAVLRLLPPLVITENEIQELLEKLGEAFETAGDRPRRDRPTAQSGPARCGARTAQPSSRPQVHSS
ncbi:diaminobutyrate--2-oxoglutarate transaminase family protein [Micromonospora sp. CPCC 205561]|uniref:diaminobutyrate--2-oxoglutarate transaminase family protein n=1 Tax=Micromonospora sp. CPCC 205561 TaxID=3122407 RepID=UPI002FF2C450